MVSITPSPPSASLRQLHTSLALNGPDKPLRPQDSPTPPKTPTTLQAQAPSLPQRHREITLADIAANRHAAGRLIAGTAAYSDSDMFKITTAHTATKAFACRWDTHLSSESAARKPCVLKQAAKHLKQPGLISLGGGLPSPENFPFEKVEITVSTKGLVDSSVETVTASMGKYDATGDVGAASGAEYDLATALNYGQATGGAQLMRWVTEHTQLVHAPPYRDWRCCLTVGSTAALEQALRMLFDPARGDALLTEEYSFSTAVETALPLGIKVVGVKMDEEGLLPESLEEMLSGWDAEARGARKPHVLYTVPSGQNPTGATQGERRRKEIYEVCSRHDVYILEDEPYYFLQMEPYAKRKAQGTAGAAKEVSPSAADIDSYLSTLAPSLLSLDTDGRVLRMDSFSKVVVPGSRLGWVTASEQAIERFIRHAEVANQGPSGFSQAALFALLEKAWGPDGGHEGLLRWLMRLREEYARRRDVLMKACEELLPLEVASWTPPAAGMFHWMNLDHSKHPDAAHRSILEIEEEIFDTCVATGVLVARGSWFRAEHDKPPSGLFFRATYASATPENMREAIRRFGEAVRKSYRLK